MTIEFPEELSEPEREPGAAPRPGVLARVAVAVPWLVAAAVGATALAFPVFVAVSPGGDDGAGIATGEFRSVLNPFGRLSGFDTPPDITVTGPAYGWLWLTVAVGFLVVASVAAVRPTAAWVAAAGGIVGGVGVGVVGAVQTSLTPTGFGSPVVTTLAAGSWLALAAGGLGVMLGVLGAIRPGFPRRAAVPAR